MSIFLERLSISRIDVLMIHFYRPLRQTTEWNRLSFRFKRMWIDHLTYWISTPKMINRNRPIGKNNKKF